jgi:hypothetical protein
MIPRLSVPPLDLHIFTCGEYDRRLNRVGVFKSSSSHTFGRRLVLRWTLSGSRFLLE